MAEEPRRDRSARVGNDIQDSRVIAPAHSSWSAENGSDTASPHSTWSAEDSDTASSHSTWSDESGSDTASLNSTWSTRDSDTASLHSTWSATASEYGVYTGRSGEIQKAELIDLDKGKAGLEAPPIPPSAKSQPERSDSLISSERRRYEAAKPSRWQKVKAHVVARIDKIHQACNRLQKEILSANKQGKLYDVSPRRKEPEGRLEHISPSRNADPHMEAAQPQREQPRSATSPEIAEKRKTEIAEMNREISKYIKKSDTVMCEIMSQAEEEIKKIPQNDLTPPPSRQDLYKERTRARDVRGR